MKYREIYDKAKQMKSTNTSPNDGLLDDLRMDLDSEIELRADSDKPDFRKILLYVESLYLLTNGWVCRDSDTLDSWIHARKTHAITRGHAVNSQKFEDAALKRLSKTTSAK